MRMTNAVTAQVDALERARASHPPSHPPTNATEGGASGNDTLHPDFSSLRDDVGRRRDGGERRVGVGRRRRTSRRTRRARGGTPGDSAREQRAEASHPRVARRTRGDGGGGGEARGEAREQFAGRADVAGPGPASVRAVAAVGAIRRGGVAGRRRRSLRRARRGGGDPGPGPGEGGDEREGGRRAAVPPRARPALPETPKFAFDEASGGEGSASAGRRRGEGRRGGRGEAVAGGGVAEIRVSRFKARELSLAEVEAARLNTPGGYPGAGGSAAGRRGAAAAFGKRADGTGEVEASSPVSKMRHLE